MSSKKDNPGLGAFTKNLTIPVEVGGSSYTWTGALTFTPEGSESQRRVSGVGRFVPVGIPPIPPIPPIPLPPRLKQVLIQPAEVPASGSATLTVGVGPVVEGGPGVIVTLDYMPPLVDGPLTVLLPSGVVSKSVTLKGRGTPGTVTVTASDGFSPREATLRLTGTPTPIPTPIPDNTLNVRDYGAKGDGKANEVQALNALISKAPAGSTLFFPAGTYAIADALKILRPDLNFLGEGDSSILKLTGNSYHVQIGSGQPFTGFSFRKLHFYGTPGKYMQDGTAHGGILNFGSKGTVFEDVLFTGCAEPIIGAGSAGSTYGTVVKNCRILGWGRVGIFCNGGERVSGCKLIQDDPNLMGERSSHGFYIHSGCNDVEIADTLIQNARKYAAQVYGEQVGTKTTGVRFLRVTVKNCANGIVFAHSQMGAGDIYDAVIEGCTISGVYAGSSLAIKNGERVIIRGNVIDGNTGASVGHSGSGLALGVWAPYEPNFSLKDVQVTGNTIKGADRGIWALPSNGGVFNNIQINGNIVTGNRMNYDITGPGVDWVPGSRGFSSGSQRIAVEDSRKDARPSDDRSEATRALDAGSAG